MVFLQVVSRSPEDTMKLAVNLSNWLIPGDVLCLYGDLGAGKTQFAKGLAMGLGIQEHVTSPTFTLINEYDGRIPMYHIDAYRLDDPEEGYELGLEEYFFGNGITLIEWPSRIRELLPENRLDIFIEKSEDEDEQRVINIKGQGQRFGDLVQELKTKCTY